MSSYSPVQLPLVQTHVQAVEWEPGNALPKLPEGEEWQSDSCHGLLQGIRKMKQIKEY